MKMRGSGVWRLNCSILEDEVFLDLAKDLWEEEQGRQQEFADMADWWEESAKPALRSLCIVYSKKAARERRDMKEYVYGQLGKAIELKDWVLVAMLKEQLRQLLQYEQNGIIIHLLAKYVDDVNLATSLVPRGHSWHKVEGR